nr:immunoglobulin heavy chain junction region [Macaca mulatta]
CVRDVWGAGFDFW